LINTELKRILLCNLLRRMEAQLDIIDCFVKNKKNENSNIYFLFCSDLPALR
jgi:hypothetical protein